MSKLEGRLVLISDNARLWSGSKRRARGQHQGARKLGQICDWDFGAREPRTGSNQIYPFGMYPNATLRRSNSPEHRTTCLWCGHLCKFLCPSPKSTVTDDSIQRTICIKHSHPSTGILENPCHIWWHLTFDAKNSELHSVECKLQYLPYCRYCVYNLEASVAQLVLAPLKHAFL